MADKKVSVYINLDCVDYFVGTLWSHFSRGKETSDFEYSDKWLNYKNSFSLEAIQIINNFRSVIKNWRNAAKQLSLNSSEIDKMESAFRV